MSSDLQTLLTEAERSFRKACEQIVQLNRRLDEMAKRYDKASRENHRSFRYSLRLRMAVTEGVRNMYYEYAANKADEITQLRCQVLREVRAGDDNDAEPIDVEGGGGADEDGDEEDGDSHSESNFVELDVGRDMLRNNRMLNDTGVGGGAMDDDDDEEFQEDEEDYSGSEMQEPEEIEANLEEGSVLDGENDMSENIDQEVDMDSVTSDTDSSSVPGTSNPPCGAVA